MDFIGSIDDYFYFGVVEKLKEIFFLFVCCVIVVEKLVEVLVWLGILVCFGSGEVFGMYLFESLMGREIIV